MTLKQWVADSHVGTADERLAFETGLLQGHFRGVMDGIHLDTLSTADAVPETWELAFRFWLAMGAMH